jgi:glycosyltransferase involved in cell wall biosynthesis
MKTYDLSVLIPARNEMFLSKTVETILKNIRGNTEVIVVLDGEWSNPGIPEDPRVTIIYHNKSIGQRAATNEACQLSNAKYVMKIDAHCIVDEGFDVKMMQEMHDDYTMIPTMYNLHAFDWVCVGNNDVEADPYTEEQARKLGCGHSIYQAPTPDKCEKCGGMMVRELVWKHRQSRKE